MRYCSNININKEIITGEYPLVKNLPIVTVSVITYNSARFIIETLKSIKAQTYPNLILQISDDCSNDETINICRKWITENKDRFIKCKIFVSEYNTGVSANINRAWNFCETTYCKDIAGDDLLLPDCIEDNVKYFKQHSNVIVLFSKARTFSVFYGKKCDQGYKHDYSFFEKSLEEQYKILIEVGNVIPASSTFINIEKIREKNIFHDERIPLLEDYPKWIQMLRKGIPFHFLDKDTVLYRINADSLSVGLFSPNYYKSNVLFYLYYFVDDEMHEVDKDKLFNIIANHETRFYTNCYYFAKKRRILRIVDSLIVPILNIFHLFKSIYQKKIIKIEYD